MPGTGCAAPARRVDRARPGWGDKLETPLQAAMRLE